MSRFISEFSIGLSVLVPVPHCLDDCGFVILPEVWESDASCLVFVLQNCLGNSGSFVLFRASPVAYGGSQARSLIRAVAAGLCHSHSNARSEPCLQTTPQLMAVLDP